MSGLLIFRISEKCGTAVHRLAVSPANLRERVFDALIEISSISDHQGTTEDEISFLEEARSIIESLPKEGIRIGSLDDEGSIPFGLNRASDELLMEIAGRIVSLNYMVKEAKKSQ